jgi:hypothetical protein
MLDDYLQSQTDEGFHHSKGSFSIRPEEARRKLAESGLKTAEKALLRLVQIGVNSGVGEIAITLGKDSVTFWFRGVKRGLLNHDRITENLRTVLLACLYSGFPRATFSNSAATWKLTRDDFSPTERRPCLPGHVCLILFRKPEGGFWQKFRQNLRKRAGDFKTLHQHVCYSPCTVLIDSIPQRPIAQKPSKRALELFLMAPDGLSPWGITAPFLMSRSGYVLSSRQATAPTRIPGNKTWDCFARLRVTAHRKHFDPSLLGWKERAFGDSCVLGQLFLPLDRRSGGLIQFVRDGVLVGSVVWPFPGNVCGVVSAVGLDTDISNLSLVQNHKQEQFLHYLRDEIMAAAQRVQPSSVGEPAVEEALRSLLSSNR